MPWRRPSGEVTVREPKGKPSLEPQLTGRKPAGRNGKANAQTGEAIAELLRMGVGITLACSKAGITRQHVYLLLKRYRNGDPTLNPAQEAFARAVDNGRADFAMAAADNVRSHSANDWKASAWLLERLAPDDYSLKQKLEISKASELTDADLAEQLCDAVRALPTDSVHRKLLFLALCDDYPHGPQTVVEADND